MRWGGSPPSGSFGSGCLGVGGSGSPFDGSYSGLPSPGKLKPIVGLDEILLAILNGSLFRSAVLLGSRLAAKNSQNLTGYVA